MLTLSDFCYDLPRGLIAQHPAEKRTGSNLLVINRLKKSIEHRKFTDFIDYIGKNDALVINNTYVVPARLKAFREKTNARLEVFIEKKTAPGTYRALIKPAKRAKKGDFLFFPKTSLRAEVIEDIPFGKVVRFEKAANLDQMLEKEGAVPLPPYIRRLPVASDKLKYQTVYALKKGAVAAPTAGLHFDKDYLNRIGRKGVLISQLTLHVGYGTFKPIDQKDIDRGRLHEEFFSVDNETAKALNKTKKNKNRIFAVGTTSCRALESAWKANGLRARAGETGLFIFPPYRFKATDALLTNFHLPKSSLLMLVSAFVSAADNLSVREGHDLLMEAYRQAVKRQYRFYSYGDAMLIL